MRLFVKSPSDFELMIQVVLPDIRVRSLTFFLAMEEWVARNLPAGKYFFTWVVNPTVIIGHNQDINAEVNLEYCRANGIDVVRRRSGGGCVYADRDNIMMSYVSPETDVVKNFAAYTSLVADQLQKIGIDATPSGRNDITVGDRKISGSAYYLMKDRSIVHSTMLYDTNIEHMLKAITPSRSKLESHQVKSVDARITMASRIVPEMSFEKFREALTSGLETTRYEVTPSDISEIQEIEKFYLRPRWLMEGK